MPRCTGRIGSVERVPACKCRECIIDLLAGADFNHLDLQASAASSLLYVSQAGIDSSTGRRAEQNNASSRGCASAGTAKRAERKRLTKSDAFKIASRTSFIFGLTPIV